MCIELCTLLSRHWRLRLQQLMLSVAASWHTKLRLQDPERPCGSSHLLLKQGTQCDASHMSITVGMTNIGGLCSRKWAKDD